MVDWLGRRQGDPQPIGADTRIPLFNEQLDMDAREQIAESLTTGLRVSTHVSEQIYQI